MMRISWVSVVVIIAAVVATSLIGSQFSVQNRDWYDRLSKPDFQPPNWAFPVVWTTIFALAAVSLIIIWNVRPQTDRTYWVMGIAILNAVLNIGWSALFFGNRLIYPAIFDAAAICLSVIAIMVLAWPISRLGSLLFILYAVWTAFATYLTYVVWRLNS